MADIDHVVAQGQENSARANLTFIERMLFAQQLEERFQSRNYPVGALGRLSDVVEDADVSKSCPRGDYRGHRARERNWTRSLVELRKLVENPEHGDR